MSLLNSLHLTSGLSYDEQVRFINYVSKQQQLHPHLHTTLYYNHATEWLLGMGLGVGGACWGRG